MDWSPVIFVFGDVPKLWNRGLPSSVEPSRTSVGGTVKTFQNSNAGSLAEPKLHTALSAVKAKVVDRDAVGSSLSLSDLRFGVTALAIGSSEDDRPSSQSVGNNNLLPIAATTRVQPIASIAHISAVKPVSSQPPASPDPVDRSPLDADLVDAFLQDPELITLLSVSAQPKPPPNRELSILLGAVLDSKKTSKAADCPALREAMARKLRYLQQFKEAHGEYVKMLWKFAAQINQLHMWGLQIQALYIAYDVKIPPALRTEQQKFCSYVDGFTVLVYQLLQQQDSFDLPKEP